MYTADTVQACTCTATTNCYTCNRQEDSRTGNEHPTISIVFDTNLMICKYLEGCVQLSSSLIKASKVVECHGPQFHTHFVVSDIS